jgi:hypothetical protein
MPPHLRRFFTLVAILLVGACAPLPPTREEVEAQRFEPVAGQSVIYIVRPYPDASSQPTPLWLDDRVMGSTYPGTFYRWVVAPGRHRIAGYAGDSGRIDLETAPGGLYFVFQSFGRPFGLSGISYFQQLDPSTGAALVRQSRLAG